MDNDAFEFPDPSDFDGSDTGTDDVHFITEPFDPTAIRVRTNQLAVDAVLQRIEHKELILNPDFQRNEVWRNVARSRLIESALMRIPLPSIYVDATDDDKWLVIDGLQRLSSFYRFVVNQDFALEGLEFLREFEGLLFSQLPRSYQRRIRETQLSVNQLDPGTPPAVKFNIFKRLNTGGLPLSPQEIRHAILQGRATSLLQEMAESKIFLRATNYGIRPTRMADRETVLRALAFLLKPYRDFDTDFDTLLRVTMEAVNAMPESSVATLRLRAESGMIAATTVFGRHAYRKRPGTPINKALFETWTVVLSALSDEEVGVLVNAKKRFTDAAFVLHSNYAFEQAISVATGNRNRVLRRFEDVEALTRKWVEELAND
jgi:hypothetical protein